MKDKIWSNITKYCTDENTTNPAKIIGAIIDNNRCFLSFVTRYTFIGWLLFTMLGIGFRMLVHIRIPITRLKTRANIPKFSTCEVK